MMGGAKVGFRVDTHVFVELGELLVGRDATALNELVKNAYDADARNVLLHAEHLEDPSLATITITDDGHGMTDETLRTGFLTIASRLKTEGDRRSLRYRRRFTGAKGIGRLAAHKLARALSVETVPGTDVLGADAVGGVITIDWSKVEQEHYVDEIETSGAVRIETGSGPDATGSGTTLRLTSLRRPWNDVSRARVIGELQTYRPKAGLLKPADGVLPTETPSLLGHIVPNDTGGDDPGFSVQFTGDLDVGESYDDDLFRQQDWMIEIDASRPAPGETALVRYRISPTQRIQKELGVNARRWSGELDHPNPATGPFFKGRIFVREGPAKGRNRAWIRRQHGVRVYLEGFRVLPYGDEGDDWLHLDRDYTLRKRAEDPLLTQFLSGIRSKNSVRQPQNESALKFLPNRQYTGAVFLLEHDLGPLKMVASREGFLVDEAFLTVRDLVRTGIDLSVRHRHACNPAGGSSKPRPPKPPPTGPSAPQPTTPTNPPPAGDGLAPGPAEGAPPTGGSGGEHTPIDENVAPTDRGRDGDESLPPLVDVVAALESAISNGDTDSAESALFDLREHLDPLLDDLAHDADTRATLRVLASVGLQIHSFIHELNASLSMLRASEREAVAIRTAARAFTSRLDGDFGALIESIADARRHMERQASSLTDVTGPDARRKRVPQNVRGAIETATALLHPTLSRRGISVANLVPAELLSPRMFASELAMLITNLMTNAAKAAGGGGRIQVTAGIAEGHVEVRMENTGVTVDLAEAERWFRPFESTTMRPDVVLGQGMGMGLPISRSVVEQYGGTIAFDSPSPGFSTAIVFRLPLDMESS